MITWTKAKVHVYSDSVSWLGKMQEHSEANKRWKNKLKNFDSPIPTENYLEMMENRLSSRGIFPGTYFIGDPPEGSKRPER